MTEMTKKERNALVVADLVGGAKRKVVAERYGITLEKLDRIVAKAADKVLADAEAMKTLVIEKPVADALPVKRSNGKSVAKERIARLNPDVTARLKVQLNREGKTVQNLTDRLEAARKRRNDSIRQLCDRGVSEREIGDLVGMTGPRINQIYHGTNGSRS